MEKSILINKIVKDEENFFVRTKNIGGKADCQNELGNFIFARKAYWNIYNIDILKQYMCDVDNYKKEEKNPVALKYAYMMKQTDTNSYTKIERLIPPIDENKKRLIESILMIYMKWETEVDVRKPRKLFSYEDTLNKTSIETYMRGELSTYSLETLYLIVDYFLWNLKNGNNLVLQNIDNLTDFDDSKYKLKSENKNLYIKDARKLSNIAMNKADKMGLSICVCIYDRHANLLLFERGDDSILGSIELSNQKAKTSILLKNKTEILFNSELKILNNGRTNDSQFCFLPGGAPIYDENDIVGSIGISGGTIGEDVEILNYVLDNF